MAVSHATYFITSRCNLACSYCFTRFNSGFSQEDSTIEVGRALVDFILMNSTSAEVGISFFGGEPLLQRDLMQEIVSYAEIQARRTEKGFHFSVTTNGTLLDDDVIRWIKAKGVNILLSLDGMPHEYNQRRFPDGKHSAELVLGNALRAIDAGIKVTVRWSLHPEHLRDFNHDVRELIRLGFDTIAVDPVYEAPWNEEHLSQYETELQEIARFYISECRRGQRITIKPIDESFMIFTLETKQKTRCGTAVHDVGVGPDGRLYPCHRFATRLGPVIGDVFKGWDMAALGQARSFDLSKVHPVQGSCRDCPVNLRCPGGGCLCVNLDVCGDIYTSPEIFCRLQRINQRIANDVVMILYAEKNPILLDKLKKPDLRT